MADTIRYRPVSVGEKMRMGDEYRVNGQWAKVPQCAVGFSPHMMPFQRLGGKQVRRPHMRLVKSDE